MGIFQRFTRLLRRRRLVSRRPAEFVDLLDDLVTVPIHGGDLRIRLDPDDSLELRRQPFEPSEVGFVKRQIQAGQTVLDVGANIGYYTLLF